MLTCNGVIWGSRYHSGQVSGRIAIIAFALLACSCAPTPQKEPTSESAKGPGINIVENQSVDIEVRRKFEAAVAFLKQHKYDQAISLLSDVAEKTPQDSAPFIDLGMAYSRLDQPKKAEENFQKALAINPDHPVTLNELGLVYRNTGRFAEARKMYERAAAKYPEFMPARRNLGILCDLYLDDVPCALKQYQAYSHVHPEDKEVKIWIAALQQKQGGR